jgi:tRNA-uridine 2-sulfurtransferase
MITPAPANAGPITVALSGGVDSAVTAGLLVRAGYDVTGVFMKNWNPDSLQNLTDCPWEQDQADAMAVAEHLGIPFKSINFEREYYESVVEYMLREYARGRTPNPDILCNTTIKFDAFMKRVLGDGATVMATGHYATLTPDQQSGQNILGRGIDPSKDQSYFLYGLSGQQLESALLPLGGLHKKEVRQIAQEMNLPNSTKPDSQGICFIGHLDLKKFLAERLGQSPAEVILLPDTKGDFEDRKTRGVSIGATTQAHYLTLGEKIGGQFATKKIQQALGEVPQLYVVAKESDPGRIYVSPLRIDPRINQNQIKLESLVRTGGSIHGTVESMVDALSELIANHGIVAQVRYRQKPLAVQSVRVSNTGEILVTLLDPIWAAAPGQSCVFYVGDRVWGGGVIATL